MNNSRSKYSRSTGRRMKIKFFSFFNGSAWSGPASALANLNRYINYLHQSIIVKLPLTSLQLMSILPTQFTCTRLIGHKLFTNDVEVGFVGGQSQHYQI